MVIDEGRGVEDDRATPPKGRPAPVKQWRRPTLRKLDIADTATGMNFVSPGEGTFYMS